MKLKYFIRWTITQIATAIMLINGWILNVDGFRHLFIAMSWVWPLAALWFLCDAGQAALKKRGRTVPSWLSDLVSGAIFIFLAWHGEYLLAGLRFALWFILGMAMFQAFEYKKEADHVVS